jgi:hypothetical protein
MRLSGRKTLAARIEVIMAIGLAFEAMITLEFAPALGAIFFSVNVSV